VKRPFAILAFVGSYLSIAALLYVAAIAEQPSNAPSILAIPLIGVALTTVPASVGFAVGALLWGRIFSVWRCITCGVLVAVGVAAVSSSIANLSPASKGEIVMNAAFAAVFVICACLPRLAKSRAGIKSEENAAVA
jgi:hypothetical protein